MESHLTVAEECKEQEILPLLIENFVENSVKYGRVAGQLLQIFVTVEQQKEDLVIRIGDNGVGFEPEVLKKVQKGEQLEDAFGKPHIGIYNCRRRLRLAYGGRAGFQISSEPGKAR